MTGKKTSSRRQHMKALPQTGETIARLLELADLTEEQLAQLIGVDPSSIRYWVEGKRSPGYAPIFKIARLLNVSSDFFGTGLPEGFEIDAAAVAAAHEKPGA